MSLPSHLARTLGGFALTGALALTAACGSDTGTTAPPSPSTASGSPTTSQSSAPQGQTVAITFSHDDVQPAGKKVALKSGETLTLEITAEAAGEMHVHSTPEQTIAFEAGQSTHTVKLDRPGLYEVEAHHPHKLVLQLEVR